MKVKVILISRSNKLKILTDNSFLEFKFKQCSFATSNTNIKNTKQ